MLLCGTNRVVKQLSSTQKMREDEFRVVEQERKKKKKRCLYSIIWSLLFFSHYVILEMCMSWTM